jgi:uncharacterized protein
MGLTRRQFLEASVIVGAGVTGRSLPTADSAALPATFGQVVPPPTGEWMAATPASAYRAYRSKSAKSADAPTWVQIDLGSPQAIDFVKIYPANEKLRPDGDAHFAGEGFPVRFKIEASNSPDFFSPTIFVDHTSEDYPNPKGRVERYAAADVKGRYVRLTATRLMDLKDWGKYLALAKIDVYSGGKEIATLQPVIVDAEYGNDNDAAQITRPARAGGEFTYMDHPENVTPSSTWKPPVRKARVPLKGVMLQGGVFQKAMEDNIRYLLESFTVDELLRQFRERAGKASPPADKSWQVQFWQEDLAGSNAGRFLMAAGNTLRWMNHPELRRRMDAVVEGIAECRQPNGYIMAYPEDTIFYSERAAYTRAWLTHGLIEAGFAGNQKAFELLRGYYDWLYQSPYLPHLLRFAVQGGQGMIANTRMHFTPVGKPDDIQVIQRHFQDNFWMDQLAMHDEEAIWQFPYDRPHCYLLTNLEAYCDLYLATGDARYRQAVEGGWDLYHDKWENPGGSISIIEFVVCPPGSYLLRAELEELCGNAFWTFLNQRFHTMDPEQEKYVSEIEKSIYNVALANQAGAAGFRYHALLDHHKEKPTSINTCCEGQGTRLIGSLPEHIYSLASDGLYVNLYEPSTIDWAQNGETLRISMSTRFPFDPQVQLQVSAVQPVSAKVRVRVPSWAMREMAVSVNGKKSAPGKPGSYVALDRTWEDGDAISFTLPMVLRPLRYTGTDQVPGYERYSVSYGPILLAAVGAPEVRLRLRKGMRPEDLLKSLAPKPGQPLHFTDEDNPGIEFMPYWQVDQEPFTCMPAIGVI